ncbi:hypothetical protein KAFR_0A05380 [Kazachstania africana CBS 2517]|uniref:Copper transport protein n=1 Tax=Kazachstania africana (strain ATCC 22294 / BCRC 22015 / CBS 2517 / CECT 1963 / NBRC 1671 / NRRL Y-8276) TaxID=1071382 RepID=H2ANM3_KAZAF|nr:hypothetical protein KAFR_0A05380 [Kazachstania africana CBS 2517]CCF55973.1 hypothetical protein KAFR_0A05380 [Kazachstania africana CBS 2517]
MDMNMATSSSMLAATISSSAMDMSMTSMASESVVSSIDMPMMMTTTTATSGNATSTMAMDMSDGMDMDMSMNYYLTKKFVGYPVLFEKLYANNKRQAFGIFVLIITTTFVYKLILFTSWCLEVHWFKKWNKSTNYTSIKVSESNSEDNKTLIDEYVDPYINNSKITPKLPNLVVDIFKPSLVEFSHDFIRIVFVFCSTMLIYMLMLVCMTFVLTYVFAVITGLALCEVFFNRCKMHMLKRWDIIREIEKCRNCPGGESCNCGRHNESPLAQNLNSNEIQKDDGLTKQEETISSDSVANQCNCNQQHAAEVQGIERNMLENSKLQEQSNDMEHNLLPAEKFI